jgi:hypothetical protein
MEGEDRWNLPIGSLSQPFVPIYGMSGPVSNRQRAEIIDLLLVLVLVWRLESEICCMKAAQ